jgi:small-conductance mechanosensitive channel
MEKGQAVIMSGAAGVAIPLIIFLITLLAGLGLRRFIFSRLSRWSKNTKSKIYDIIVESTKGPFIIWFLMLGIYFALEASRLPESLIHIADKTMLVLAIASVTFVLANILTLFIKSYSAKIESALPVTSLTQNITRIIVFGIGIMVILNALGISVTPILATLGVGGLAVALALQDTFANFFAGFHIIMARQIRIGDYIKLESGEEGYVTDINWRTTKIRMLPNNVVLVPNLKLSQAIITNYYLPDKEMAVLVNVGVHYDSDLEKVERVTCEVAKETLGKVQGGVAGFDPFIRYNTFADSSVNFTVILRAKEFVDQYLIKHEFIKRLHRRYAREGIVIPYPIRTVRHEQQEVKR